MPKLKSLTAISLYTGVGGLDFGFEAAGFRTSLAIEIDPVACRVLRHNRPSWNVLEEDIANISVSRIFNTASLQEVDVLIGGPPCQPFSKSGYWSTGTTKRLEDSRAGTLGHYMKILKATLPRAFLLENVLGLSYAGKNEAINFIRQELADINKSTGSNYSFAMEALNAADFGVPQLRERVFIVGARDGKQFRFPRKTHGSMDGEERDSTLLPHSTVWDALGDLPQNSNDPRLAISGKWAELLPSIPEGANYLWHTPRGGGEPLFGWRTRYWNFLLKLAKRQPSWTIQAQPGPSTGPFHWRSRRLSGEELCRLQTFPRKIEFLDCKRADIQRLIGNAVPSALAEALAREIRRQFFQSRKTEKPLSLIPTPRTDLPKPEPTWPVPQKYMVLAGAHSEHPGTGKGAGAQRRLSRVA